MDSACTSTVAGDDWARRFKRRCAATVLEKNIFKSYHPTTVPFGGGDNKISSYLWRPPVTIGGAHACLDVAILDDWVLQFLIGKDALVEMGVNIDFTAGCLSSKSMGWRGMRLQETKGGHNQVKVLPSVCGPQQDLTWNRRIMRFRERVNEALIELRQGIEVSTQDYVLVSPTSSRELTSATTERTTKTIA